MTDETREAWGEEPAAPDADEYEIVDDPETGGKIVPLLHPITVGERTVDRFHLRRPKAKQLREMDQGKGDMAKTLRLIASLSGQPMAVVDELDAEDLARIGGVLEGFFGNALPIGPT